MEAEELLHSGMLHAFEKTKGNLEGIGNPKGWLTRVLYNHTLDSFRKNNRTFSLGDLWPQMEEAEYDLVRAHAPSAEEDLLQEESFHALKQALDAMPHRLRRPMQLRAFQGLPYTEIAGQLQISPANARKRCQEGRDFIREFMQGPQRPERHLADEGSARSPSGGRMAQPRSPRDETPRPDPAPQEGFVVTLDLGQGLQDDRLFWVEKPPQRLRQRINSARKYVAKHPNGWRRRRELAFLHLWSGDLEAAIQEGLRVLAKQGRQVLFRMEVAEWMAWSDDLAGAIQLLEQDLKQSPDSFRVLLQGQGHRLRQEWQALFDLIDRVPGQTRHPVLQQFRAEALLQLGKWGPPGPEMAGLDRDLQLRSLVNKSPEQDVHRPMAWLRSAPREPWREMAHWLLAGQGPASELPRGLRASAFQELGSWWEEAELGQAGLLQEKAAERSPHLGLHAFCLGLAKARKLPRLEAIAQEKLDRFSPSQRKNLLARHPYAFLLHFLLN